MLPGMLSFLGQRGLEAKYLELAS